MELVNAPTLSLREALHHRHSELHFTPPPTHRDAKRPIGTSKLSKDIAKHECKTTRCGTEQQKWPETKNDLNDFCTSRENHKSQQHMFLHCGLDFWTGKVVETLCHKMKNARAETPVHTANLKTPPMPQWQIRDSVLGSLRPTCAQLEVAMVEVQTLVRANLQQAQLAMAESEQVAAQPMHIVWKEERATSSIAQIARALAWAHSSHYCKQWYHGVRYYCAAQTLSLCGIGMTSNLDRNQTKTLMTSALSTSSFSSSLLDNHNCFLAVALVDKLTFAKPTTLNHGM